ncbi:MAG: response regulator transcription factor [Fibrobacterales bacterium]
MSDSSKFTILIIEDEAQIAEGLVDLFQFKGYEADVAQDGESGLTMALTGKYDLIILDLMLPKMDGFTVCNKIREQTRELPIIILSAKASEEDIVNGLTLGADDYINKPFSVGPLFARVEAVLRRSRKILEKDNFLVLDTMTIDFKMLQGDNDNEKIYFTRKEIEILKHLNINKNNVVSRTDLLREVWGYDDPSTIDTRTVDIHITKLRKKIERDPASPKFLLTLRGKGYQLCV